MEFNPLDLILHLDAYLDLLVTNYGPWIYAILFAIIFCKTGLVVTPFLPGDSLLFVAGALAAGGDLYVHGLFALLALTSFSGDNTNYWIGRFIGPRVFTRSRSWALNPAHLERTRQFYERHGGKAIILARFAPLVRTFTPFVAGVARMSYVQFALYNVLGGIGWVTSMTWTSCGM